MPALVDASDLIQFPEAPFAEDLVASAADQVRILCGWHIAPEVTETLTVESWGGPVLSLPTLHLTAVTEVRDVTGTDPAVLDRWRKSQSGMLIRIGGWPFGTVEVDVTHGYPVCPDGLLAVIAERVQQSSRDRSIRQESLGSRSIALGADPVSPAGQVLSRYTIPAIP